MPRYVVMSAEDAKKISDEVYLPPADSWETAHECLVDTARGVLVWQDFDVSDAPEDMYLYRNLSVFVRELNRLDEEG